MSTGPLPQALLLERLLPRLQQEGTVFRKHRCVMARPATAGEVVVSITAAGVETVNTAGDDDFVVRNLTEAGERYLVRGPVFRERYAFDQADRCWSRYRPLGRVMGLEVTESLLGFLGVQSPFHLEAPWQALQIILHGDYLACPLGGREIYRIARQEFGETYVPDHSPPEERAAGHRT